MVGFVIVGAINGQFCHLWELNGRFYCHCGSYKWSVLSFVGVKWSVLSLWET